MSLSLAAIRAMYQSRTDEVFLECLTITHPDLAQPLYYVNDTVDLVRAAGTFTAWPFKFTDGSDTDSERPVPKLQISNVDRAITQQLRSLNGYPTITVELVRHSAPDTIEWGPYGYIVRNYQFDKQTLQLELGDETDLFQLPANKWIITPALCPGSF